MALRQTSIAEFSELADPPEQQVVYRKADGQQLAIIESRLAFSAGQDGLAATGRDCSQIEVLGIPGYIISRLGVVPERLRTS